MVPLLYHIVSVEICPFSSKKYGKMVE